MIFLSRPRICCSGKACLEVQFRIRGIRPPSIPGPHAPFHSPCMAHRRVMPLSSWRGGGRSFLLVTVPPLQRRYPLPPPGHSGAESPPCRWLVVAYDPQSHRWELPGSYPVFDVVMVIYHWFERIWRIIVTPDVSHNIYDHEEYYPSEIVHIHIQLLTNII